MQIERAAQTLAKQFRDTLVENGVPKEKADSTLLRTALTFSSMLASELVQNNQKVRPE